MSNPFNIRRSSSYILSLIMVTTPTLISSLAPAKSVTLENRIPYSSTRLFQIDELNHYASVGSLKADVVDILVDNKEAFLEKIKLIEKAEKGDVIRMVYFIFSDDYSSSYLTQKLIEAADRGAKIQLLLDLHQNYRRIDLFKALEEQSSNIQVRFYNRPTKNLVLQAAYMTMPCNASKAEQQLDPQICVNQKGAAVDAAVAKALSSMSPADLAEYHRLHKLNLTNLRLAKTGEWLSGLYTKAVDIMAKAIIEGQELDFSRFRAGEKLTAEDKKGFAEFMKLIWTAKLDPKANKLQQLSAGLQLKLAFMLYGESKGLNDLYNSITSMAPIDSSHSKVMSHAYIKRFAAKDISHLTDYAHHKLLMLNGHELVMGGRNVEDSYHMSKPDLIGKYMFLDTDVHVKLNHESLAMEVSFDKLWNFESMVISVDDILAIAPNDIVANYGIKNSQCLASYIINKGNIKLGGELISNEEQVSKFLATEEYRDLKRKKWFKKDLKEFKATICMPHLENQPFIDSKKRKAMAIENLFSKAKKYVNYMAGPDFMTGPKKKLSLDLLKDKNAELFYLENLHFDKNKNFLNEGELIRRDEESENSLGIRSTRRQYGLYDYNQPDTVKVNRTLLGKVNHLLEGKKTLNPTRYIHDAMIRGIENVCADSSKDKSKRQKIIFQNAYFAPPSNLLTAFANMINGVWDCSQVDLVIMTNSFDTTDLSPVNFLARYAFLALVLKYREVIKSRNEMGNNRHASLTYLEYQDIKKPGQRKRSLHSKVTILGDKDIIVGSANADYRSYMMDTNNAMYIKNAPNLVSNYTKLIENIVNISKGLRVAPRYELVGEDGFFPTVKNLELLDEKSSPFIKSAILASDKEEIIKELKKYGMLETIMQKLLGVLNDKAENNPRMIEDLSDSEYAALNKEAISLVEGLVDELQAEGGILHITYTKSKQVIDALPTFKDTIKFNKWVDKIYRQLPNSEDFASFYNMPDDVKYKKRERHSTANDKGKLKPIPSFLRRVLEAKEAGDLLDDLLKVI